LINAADPLSGMTLVWKCDGLAHCVVEHHQGYLYLFTDAARQGQMVDSHYLLRSPVDASSCPRVWEVGESQFFFILCYDGYPVYESLAQ